MTLAHLAALNAAASGISTFFVAVGWWAIRRQQEWEHLVCMIVATVATVVFLMGDALATWPAGQGATILLSAHGLVGGACAVLLISHVVLACVLPVLMAAVYVPVWRQHWNVHRRVGKLVTPVWLYVAATGMVVNLLRCAGG